MRRGGSGGDDDEDAVADIKSRSRGYIWAFVFPSRPSQLITSSGRLANIAARASVCLRIVNTVFCDPSLGSSLSGKNAGVYKSEAISSLDSERSRSIK